MTAADWQPVLTLMAADRFEEAIAALDRRLAAKPLDGEALILRAVAKSARPGITDAAADLWRALAIDPASAGARAALGDLFVRDSLTAPPERPGGGAADAGKSARISDDRRARYEFAARWLRQALAPAHRRTGADILCADGSGTRILANICGCRLVGIDDAPAGVAGAEAVHGDHRVLFRHARMPFELMPCSFDFAVACATIEHLPALDRLIACVDAAVTGPLLLSFALDHDKAARGPTSAGHAAVERISDTLARFGRRVTAVWGQKVHRQQAGRHDGHLPIAQMWPSLLGPDSHVAIVVAERR